MLCSSIVHTAQPQVLFASALSTRSRLIRPRILPRGHQICDLDLDRDRPMFIPLHLSQRHPIRKAVSDKTTIPCRRLSLALPRLHTLCPAVMEPCPDDPIVELLVNYNELNSSTLIDEVNEEPSPLEFLRYVARNTPFVVRAGAANWSASKNWTAGYLRNYLQDHHINVAVTPKG